MEDCVNALLQAFAFPRRLKYELIRKYLCVNALLQAFAFPQNRFYFIADYSICVNALLQAFAFPHYKNLGNGRIWCVNALLQAFAFPHPFIYIEERRLLVLMLFYKLLLFHGRAVPFI